MVTPVTNLGRNGLSDWLIQRVTAVVLLCYTVFMFVVLFAMDMDYACWKALFSHLAMRIFSAAALFAMAWHAWIGLWSISTDYLTERLLGRTATGWRLAFQCCCALLLFVYGVWGVHILWS